jgi:hypothetical protein
VNKDLQVMSLKQWVNDKPTMDEFIKHIDDLIFLQHRVMEQATDPVEVYRAQGAINQLRKLRLLRETINGS